MKTQIKNLIFAILLLFTLKPTVVSAYYDPELGRFIQPDTVIPDLSNPQSYNRYSYCLNNPLRYTDPTGHWGQEAADWWSGTVDSGMSHINAPPQHWIYNGTVGTVNSLAGGVAEPLRLGSSAGAVSGNPNATAGQIAIAGVQEVSRAAAVIPVGAAIGKGAGALVSGLTGSAERGAVGELAGAAGGAAGKTGQGLTTPSKVFGSKTADEAANALENKLGPPRNSPEHQALGNKSYFNEKTGTSYNVHTDPNHGPPHVDVKVRGSEKQEFPLKTESGN